MAVRKDPRRCAPRAARTVVILRFSLIALGGSGEAAKQAGRETSSGQPNITARGAAYRRGPSNKPARLRPGKASNRRQHRSGPASDPPASGSGRPSRRWLTGGILVRSVGNRPAQPALTYAPVTRLRPCCLFRATANTPESLSHAGAFARHRRNSPRCCARARLSKSRQHRSGPGCTCASSGSPNQPGAG